MTNDGTPCAVKVARTVWSGGKLGDYLKGLPITIVGRQLSEYLVRLLRLRQLCSHEQRSCEYRTAGRTGALQCLCAGLKGECTAR